MVESKTAKRKAAAKVAARAAHEIAIERKAKKEAESKPAAPSPGISPVAGRTRTKKAAAPKGKSPPSSSGKKRKADADAEAEEEKEMEAALQDEDQEDQEEGEEGEGDEFSSQRLVVKLESKQQQQLNSKLKKLKPDPKPKTLGAANQAESCVVYLGRVPYGFFEAAMRDYFTQFGTVSRLRLSRNRKTGKSKHYAFIEFDHPEGGGLRSAKLTAGRKQVAKIVAETHDKMLIADRAVSCALVPAHKVHPQLFKGADKPFRRINWKAVAKTATRTKRTPEKEAKRVSSLVKKEQQKRAKLKELGIDLDFTGYEGLLANKETKKSKTGSK